MEHPLFYRPSLRLGPVTVLGVLAVGLAAGGLVGLLYGAMARLNPVTLLNPLLLVGAGLGLAAATRWGVQRSGCTNPWLAAGGGLAAGGTAVYASWVAWIWVLGGGSSDSLFFVPGQLVELAGLLAADGVWSVLGAAVSGAPLRALWLGEALTVLALPAAWPLWTVLRTPFCEEGGGWAQERETLKLSAIEPTRRAAWTGVLGRGSFGGLAGLEPVPDAAANFTRCTVRFGKLPGPKVFLTLVGVETRVEPGGKHAVTQTLLTRNMAVSRVVWAQMRDRAVRATSASDRPAAAAAGAGSPLGAPLGSPFGPPFGASPGPAASPPYPSAADHAGPPASPNGLPGMPPAA